MRPTSPRESSEALSTGFFLFFRFGSRPPHDLNREVLGAELRYALDSVDNIGSIAR
jgi:hypothetical protein